MKANEFVKRFGMDDAREYLCGASFWEVDGKPIALCVDDLKRLVESWELVESYGGIDEAKDFISPYGAEQLNKKIYSPMLRLKQAIADVESCQ